MTIAMLLARTAAELSNHAIEHDTPKLSGV